MRHTLLVACASLAASHLLTAPSYSQGPRKGNVVGAMWQYTARKVVDGRLTGEEMRGRFRVYNHEVFRGPGKVGSITPKGRMEATMTITGWPEMNGSVTLKQTRYGNPKSGEPPLWLGLFTRADGTTWRLHVVGFER